jgi:hypothetical protein
LLSPARYRQSIPQRATQTSHSTKPSKQGIHPKLVSQKNKAGGEPNPTKVPLIPIGQELHQRPLIQSIKYFNQPINKTPSFLFNPAKKAPYFKGLGVKKLLTPTGQELHQQSPLPQSIKDSNQPINKTPFFLFNPAKKFPLFQGARGSYPAKKSPLV